MDIVIVNYRSVRHLIKCLMSIDAPGMGDFVRRIFVVDNSENDEIEKIRPIFPQAVIIKNDRNVGFASAINQGIKRSHADYIVLLNPDTVLLDGFFELILGFMTKHPNVGIVGPRILEINGFVQGSARSFPTPLTTFFGRSTFLTKYIPNNPFSRKNVLTIKYKKKVPLKVDWVSGACMVVRRKAIEETGLMDERFFLYWEDADWCKRMGMKGWQIVYFPPAGVVHLAGSSSKKRPLRSISEFHLSAYMLFSKHAHGAMSLIKPAAILGLTMRCMILCFMYLLKRSSKELMIKQGKPGRIRIVRIISRLNIGGPAIQAITLSSNLMGESFQTQLISGNVSPGEGEMKYLARTMGVKPDLIPYFGREISPLKDFRVYVQLLISIRRFKPHIIHTHTAKAGFLGRLAVLNINILRPVKERIRILHTYHGHIFHNYFNPIKTFVIIQIERFFAKFTDRIIVISSLQKIDICKKFRIAEEAKVECIPLGFDLSSFKNCALYRKNAREKYLSNGPQKAFLVGIIGRLTGVKNHIMLLKAIKHLKDSDRIEPFRFFIIGDGERKREIEDKVAKWDLGDSVIFKGWQKDMPQLYSALDAVVLTSKNEGTPVTLIEAMAAEKPVLATDVGGVPDLLGPVKMTTPQGFSIAERGILVPSGNSKALAHALLFLYKKEDTLAEMTRRAQTFVCEQFSIKRLLGDIKSLYGEFV